MGLDMYLSPEIISKRDAIKIRILELEKTFGPYVEKSVFPPHFIDFIKNSGINGIFSKEKKYGAMGCTYLEATTLIFEFGRVDMSFATFLGVHFMLCAEVVEHCGDEEQKARMLPDLLNFNKIGAFALTEPDYGSDATSLKSFAVKATDGRDGWILNGVKRWIGNGTFADYIVVWAKNREDKNKLQGFVVTKGSPGLKCTKIEGKYSLRMT